MTDAEQRGIDRRTLIKRAAVVGAAAWTAPIIVGSLTSPAAALTGPKGCNTVCYNQNCSFNSTSLCPFPGCTSESASAESACIQLTGTAGPSGDSCAGGDTVTATVHWGCTSCEITGYSYNVTGLGGGCGYVPLTPASTQTFTLPNVNINQICLQLEC